MSWIETITKEGFQIAVREAMKPDLDKVSLRLEGLGNRLGEIEQRVSRLEGTIEGSMRANEANTRAYESTIRAMLSEFKSDMLQRMLEDRK